MRIAIIGVGNVGSALARACNVAGHTVVMSSREVILRAAASLAEAVVVLLAPGARVVKAFNTILASRFNDPVVDGVPLDDFYAGDDADAKRVVAGLLAEMGFHPIDTGELLTARALELIAFLNVTLNARNGWPWRSGWKLLGPTG